MDSARNRDHTNAVPFIEEKYVPSGANLDTLEKSSTKNDQQNHDDLLLEAERCASAAFLAQLSVRDLFTRRLVCREWHRHIDKIMKENVKHIFLFEDRFNVREYEAFLKKTDLLRDRKFRMEDDESQTSLILLVNNIEELASSSKPFGCTDNVEKLTFYGGSQNAPNWHKFLGKIVSDIIPKSKLSSLVIHRYGYYKEKKVLESKSEIFTQLSEIHLVQPSVIQNMKFSGSNVPAGYKFAGGHVPSTDDTYCHVVKPETHHLATTAQTKVYVHHLVNFKLEQTLNPFEDIIKEESYE